MDQKSREFGLFIDGLRMDRNMSREELCEGIMSLSQYKRYLRGDTSIPNNKLIQIADKLKFTIDEIHRLYQEKSNTQLNLIDDIYQTIKENNYQLAYKKTLKMKKDSIFSDFNQLYFNFCLIYVQHKLHLVSDIHVLEIYSKMINYPECLKTESFNWVELSVLFQMILVSSKIENYELVNFMYEILTDDKYNFSIPKDQTLLPRIYLVIGQVLGKQEKYHETIEITTRGINHCLATQSSYALSSLFLARALARKSIGEIELGIEDGKKALALLVIENNKTKLADFKKLLQKAFDQQFDETMQL